MARRIGWGHGVLVTIYGGLFVFSLFIKLEFDGDGRGGRPHHKKWGTEQMVVINHTLFLTSGWEG